MFRFIYCILTVLIIFTATVEKGYAQNPLYSNTYISGEFQQNLVKSVAFSFENTPLREALVEFSAQTGIILVYSMNEQKLMEPVNATIYLTTPIAALQQILDGTGLEIMLSSSGRIVLIPRIIEYERNGDFAGKVLDHHTGDPIPRVNIYVEELNMGTVTNAEGQFSIKNMPAERYTLRASHIAYETIKEEVFVSSEESNYKSLVLNPAVFNLGDIFIDDRTNFFREGGLGVSGTSITEDEMAKTGRNGIGQVLRSRVSGITFFEYGAGTGAGHLQFRGGGSFYNPIDYVRINVDGIPVDGIFWETFITDNLSRIEILRGPQASGQFGANAMSGVINLYTDTGKKGTVGARLSAAGGLAKSSANDFDPLWQEYFASVGGGSEIITSGISLRHTRDEGVLVNRESRLSAITAGTEIKPDDRISIRGSLRFSELDSGWPYSQTIQTFTDVTLMNPDVSSRQQRGIGSINVNVGLFDWWKQRFIVGSEYMYGTLEYNKSEYFIPVENGLMQERWVTVQERDVHIRPTVHYNSKFVIPLGDNEHATFSGGVEVQREDRTRDIRKGEDKMFERIFEGGSEQTIIGKYLSWSFHSADDLDVSVGFRVDQLRTEGKIFNYPMSPSLNIGYRFSVTDSWLGLIRGSVGRGIRHPHHSMIFGRPPVEIPNPELSAEIMDGWEAGLSNFLLGGKISLSTTFFSQETRDAFQSVARKDDPNSYQWINGGRVTNRGLEIEAMLIPIDWVQLGINHIFHWNRAIDLRQEEPHEFTLLRVPDIAGSFFVNLNPIETLSFNFDFYYVGERLDVDLETWYNEGRSPRFSDYEKMFSPYLKIDFYGRYLIFSEHEIFLNVYNLMNDMSREYGGMPPSGRMVIFGLRYNI